MDKHDRIQQLYQLFSSRRYPVPMAVLMEELECTERTVRRNIQTLNDFHGTNVVYSREHRGWYNESLADERTELPGLWFSTAELQSLALLLHLIRDLGQGVLNPALGSAQSQIGNFLQARGIAPEAFEQHIKYLPLGHRQCTHRAFAAVSEAILKQRRIRVDYLNFNQEASQRELSPQTLVYYRENWYLDAWCHLRQALRTFSVARIQSVVRLTTEAKQVAQEDLDRHYATGYGIFAGQPQQTAVLRFLPAIAHELAGQQWHPDQHAEWQGEDYVLQFPYADDRELIQDLLRWMPHVKVEAPDQLREGLIDRLNAGLALQSTD